MDKLCVATFLLVTSFLPLAWSLQCQAGLDFLSDLRNDANMTTEECTGPNQSCLRLEATALAFDFLNVTIVVNQCRNTPSCGETEACTSLPRQFLLFEGRRIGVDPQQLQFQTRTCEVACCYGNNCNNATIAVIRETATSESVQEGMQMGDMKTTEPTGGAGHLTINKTFSLFVITLLVAMVIF